jgi:transposase
MIIHPGFVGIDVSKLHLDVYDGSIGHPERFANDAPTAASLAKRYAGRKVFVVFEATGVYDRTLRQALAQTGIAYTRIPPARARDFAKAAGFLAKTDAVDARMLATLAQCLKPPAEEPPPVERERIAALHRRRDQLVATRQQERTRRSECADLQIAASLDRHIVWLDQAIDDLEQQLRTLFEANAELKRLQTLLRSAPGIGPVAATTLIALLPELGRRSSKTIAALAGLAPYSRDSGQRRGQRSIRGGRKRVRNALYMAALAAARSRTRFRAIYQAMRAAGKPPKLALVAIARKLLVVLNAIVRDQKKFQVA